MKLTKRQLSFNIHASESTIYLWERNKVRPSLSQIPKIIEFLGRNPFERETEKLGDKIRECKRIHGLTQKKFAAQQEIDPTTLASWERGDHQPTKKLLDKIKSVLIF